uniref:Uncharacterized protein n=1 Tax=Anguilla anguilla TaxID=7936 RepID=A0A0E9SKA2_ANGAN
MTVVLLVDILFHFSGRRPEELAVPHRL